MGIICHGKFITPFYSLDFHTLGFCGSYCSIIPNFLDLCFSINHLIIFAASLYKNLFCQFAQNPYPSSFAIFAPLDRNDSGSYTSTLWFSRTALLFWLGVAPQWVLCLSSDSYAPCNWALCTFSDSGAPCNWFLIVMLRNSGLPTRLCCGFSLHQKFVRMFSVMPPLTAIRWSSS